MEVVQAVITAAAFLLSVLALMFTRRSWLESNRPIVTAEIVTGKAGNIAITYNLMVYNTGTRPAVDIRLKADKEHILSALREDVGSAEVVKKEIFRCFSDAGRISLLHQQRKKPGGFGLTSTNEADNVLVYDSVIPVEITYKDLYGRRFKTRQDLIVKDSESIAGSVWSST